MQNFPKTLAAAKRAEGATWELGDALLVETSDDRNLSAVSEELAANGIEYSEDWLREVRWIAKQFPPKAREHYSFELHREAASPERLEWFVRQAKEDGARLSTRYIRGIDAGTRLTERKEPPVF